MALYIKNYIILILVFALFFASFSVQPPLFGFALCAVVLPFGILAIRRHQSKYFKTMVAIAVTVQLIFFMSIPYWVLNGQAALNVVWPYFPELLWTTGKLVFWYYLVSFIILPVIVYLFGRRAWCSFICGTGTLAETLGDEYRKNGVKSTGIPNFFTAFKWVLLLASIAITIVALTGDPSSQLFNMIFLFVFIILIRNVLMLAGNIILMPKFGTRIWCKYFCPQGLIIGIISRLGRFALVKDESLCNQCGTCNQNCSMSIDIKNGPALNRSGDCVGCGVCVEVCPNQALSMTTARQQYDARGRMIKPHM